MREQQRRIRALARKGIEIALEAERRLREGRR